MVRQAIDTAVSASISTPVGPVTFTVARITQPGSVWSGAMSTVTFDNASGWQSGINSEVRLAAMMPAMRAAPSTSPFFALPDRISSSVAWLMMTRPSATAMRSLAGLSDTSTMRASPPESIWVRAGPVSARPALGDLSLFLEDLSLERLSLEALSLEVLSLEEWRAISARLPYRRRRSVPTAPGSRPPHRPAASGFRRPGRSRCRHAQAAQDRPG